MRKVWNQIMLAGNKKILLIPILTKLRVSEETRKKIKITTIGIVVNRIANGVFNFPITSAVLVRVGPQNLWECVGVLSIISFCMYYGLILIHDYTKTDWLSIELLKRAKMSGEEIPQNRITRFLLRLSKKGNFFIVAYLIFGEPSLMVLYLRKGFFLYNKIPNIKMWGLFLVSVVASTLVWVLESNIILLVFKFLIWWWISVPKPLVF